MKKLSLLTCPFADDFHDLLHNLANLGYAGVELGTSAPYPTPDSNDTKEKRDKLKKMMQSHGLEFSALIPDYRGCQLVSTADAETFHATFAKNLAFAADLGITTLSVSTAEPSAVVQEQNRDPLVVRDRVVAAFERCAREAAPYKIRIAWEFDPALVLGQPADILDVVRRVRDERKNFNFGVLFNTHHARHSAGNQILDLLNSLKGKINHLHLADATAAAIGEGVVDFKKLLPELLTAGIPNDWWVVNLFAGPTPWEAAADSKRYLDRLRHLFDA